jgi:hypothetical protein
LVERTASLGSSLGTRAPAVLGLPGGTAQFLVGAALEGGGVGLWLIGSGSSVMGVLMPAATIGDVPAVPTGVVLGAGAATADQITIGVGIESGCAPERGYFAEATVDLTMGTIAVSPSVRVDAGERAAFVSPAWSDRGEWLVAWIGSTIFARRVRVDTGGPPTFVDPSPVSMPGGGSAPSTLGVLRSLARGTDWNVSFFDQGATPGFSQTVIGCATR